MHQTNIPYLKRGNINKYFTRLSELLIEYNLGEHNILVVGGAAMALKNKFGRATVDIDICIREQHALSKCCEMVAQQFSLTKDWINADVMHSDSFSYRLFEDVALYKSFNNILNVFVVSDINLLCMKLVSFRPKDINDINILTKKLSKAGIKYADVKRRFAYLYGSTYLLKSRQDRYIYKALR